MDPTKTLELIRELVNESPEVDDIDALPNAVKDLDEWMSRGGFPPEQWKPQSPMGRPRRQEDGPTRDDVVHGTRRGYNKGCRCVPCTGANRDAATARRIAKQMEDERDG